MLPHLSPCFLKDALSIFGIPEMTHCRFSRLCKLRPLSDGKAQRNSLSLVVARDRPK